jgi:hypothetical protein
MISDAVSFGIDVPIVDGDQLLHIQDKGLQNLLPVH